MVGVIIKEQSFSKDEGLLKQPSAFSYSLKEHFQVRKSQNISVFVRVIMRLINFPG